MGKRQANDMIHCSVCGEDYSASYKRCPFCEEEKRASKQQDRADDYDEYGDDYDEESGSRRKAGGKRLLGVRRRGGGYSDGPTPWKIIRTVLSILIIILAIFVVISILKPLVDRGNVEPPPEGTPSQALSSAAPTFVPPDNTKDPGPVATDEPAGSDPTPVATPDPSQIPATQTADSFTLALKDFTISKDHPEPIKIAVTFYPKGSTGTITWTSSNPSALVVDGNGVVTAVGKGTATITATMAGGYSQSCIARSTLSSGTTNPSTNTYTVKSGDTLYGIATRHGTTVAELKRLNGLTSDIINIGQVLKLPGGETSTSGGDTSSDSTPPPTSTAVPTTSTTYTVVRGDTLSGIAAKFNTTVQKLMELNDLKNADSINIGQVLKLP